MIVDQDELDIDVDTNMPTATLEILKPVEHVRPTVENLDSLMNRTTITSNTNVDNNRNIPIFGSRGIDLSMDNEFPLWAGDSSARRSPEGNLNSAC